jgi:hypothetical protein
MCVHLFQVAGLTVQNQEFVVLEHEDEFLQSADFDGIMGMSYKFISESYNIIDSFGNVAKHQTTPLFQNLVRQHGINNTFSLYLTLYVPT